MTMFALLLRSACARLALRCPPIPPKRGAQRANAVTRSNEQHGHCSVAEGSGGDRATLHALGADSATLQWLAALAAQRKCRRRNQQCGAGKYPEVSNHET
jgi:hypothetical protein